MRITKVEAFAIQAAPVADKAYWGARAWGQGNVSNAEVSSEYPSPIRRRTVYSQTIDTVIIRLVTDLGSVGYGEAKAPVAPGVTKEIVDQLLAPILLGADPRDITVHWERMFAGMRVRGHRMGFYMEAISGIDIALWDLTARIHDVPIFQLLGGSFRSVVRVYASALTSLPLDASEDDFARLAEEARQVRQQGYSGLKIAVGKGLRGDIKSVRTVRDALGDEYFICVDAAGAYDRAQARRLGRELEDLGISWFEMPIFPEDIDGYVELAKALDIPIALDCLTSRYDASEFIRRGALDIVQPDVCRAGGITECRRIAELADTFGLAYAPHVSIGSAIHLAATAQLASAMPNTLLSEYWTGQNPIGNSILRSPVTVKDSYLLIPSGPGLGIDLDVNAIPELR